MATTNYLLTLRTSEDGATRLIEDKIDGVYVVRVEDWGITFRDEKADLIYAVNREAFVRMKRMPTEDSGEDIATLRTQVAMQRERAERAEAHIAVQLS